MSTPLEEFADRVKSQFGTPGLLRPAAMLPDVVDLGVHTYTIDADEDTAALLATDEKLGATDHSRLLIRLDSTRPGSVVRETLVHELLHAAWDATPLRLKDDDTEEATVTALAPLILDLIRRNPALLEYLTDD